MANIGTGFGASTVRAEVNRDDYMFSKPEDSDLARKYLAWLSQASPGSKPFAIDVGSTFGCVFGIRFGRHWSLYLQESMMVSTVRFHKKSDVAKTKTGNNISYQVNGSLTRGRAVPAQVGRVFHDRGAAQEEGSLFKKVHNTVAVARVGNIFNPDMDQGIVADLR